jgi:hypothetical protein
METRCAYQKGRRSKDWVDRICCHAPPSILLAVAVVAVTMTSSPAPANPLATPAQIAAEKRMLQIETAPPIQAAREKLRQLLLTDPGAQTADGRAALDRVLDQWIRHFILTTLTGEQREPALLWVADNTPRTWFGHLFPGDVIAGDNPDNSNRISYLDGDSSYLLVGRYGSPKAGQFSLNISVSRLDGGMGKHLTTLTDQKIMLEQDGTFRVTIDSKPANGRRNHLRVEPGRLLLAARDSRSDWKQQATTLSLRLVSGPGMRPAANDIALIARIADELPAFVDYWRKFKDGFLGFPEPNILVMPKRRDSEGGWGYIGGGRFRIADDEAIVITMWDGGSDYIGFQVTDPWTLRPETVLRTSSLNKTQAKRNPDGSYTYIVALQDPGVANWIDTAGLHEGWMQLRWQNVPSGGNPTAHLVKVVKLKDIDAIIGPGVPRADLSYRQEQIRKRVEEFALRTSETPPDPLPH